MEPLRLPGKPLPLSLCNRCTEGYSQMDGFRVFTPKLLCLRLGKALSENTQTSNLIQNSSGPGMECKGMSGMSVVMPGWKSTVMF